jgi:hypothetical protein
VIDLERGLQEVLADLEAMRGREPVRDIEVEWSTAAGVVTASLVGECQQCGGLWRPGCRCVRLQAVELAVRLAGLPAEAQRAGRHPLRTGHAFQAGAQKVGAVAAENFLTGWCAQAARVVPTGAPVLRLCGPPAVGKTWCALRLALGLLTEGVRVRWVSMRALLEELRTSSDRPPLPDVEGPAGLMARLVARPPKVLVLDNVADGSDGWHRRVYDALVMTRVEAGLPTILTHWVPRATFDEAMGPRLSAWLAEASTALVFMGAGGGTR